MIVVLTETAIEDLLGDAEEVADKRRHCFPPSDILNLHKPDTLPQRLSTARTAQVGGLGSNSVVRSGTSLRLTDARQSARTTVKTSVRRY
jgi:hypothetical protein